MEILIKLLINILSLMIVVFFIPGINIDRWQTFGIVGLFLVIINTYLKPLIIILTLPLNIISLGLFTLIINGSIFYIISKLIKGFSINSFWNAFLGALIFSITSFILTFMFDSRKNIRFSFYRYDKKFADRRHTKRIDVIDGEVVEYKNKETKKLSGED